MSIHMNTPNIVPAGINISMSIHMNTTNIVPAGMNMMNSSIRKITSINWTPAQSAASSSPAWWTI